MPSDSSNNPPAVTRKQRRAFQIIAAFLFVVIAVGVVVWFPRRHEEPKISAARIEKAGYATLPPSFSGSSEKLNRTVVIPTLESAIPKGKSALWCASLALAWKQMEADVVNGPLALEGAEEISQKLTNANLPDIRPEDKLVVAGAVKDGIIERMRKEMHERFPDAPSLGQLPGGVEVVLAYAYLQVGVRFKHVFPTSETPIRFLDGEAKEAKEVCAFGVPEFDSGAGMATYRKQVHVLFHDDDQFAIDVDRHSEPYQIMLARVKRPGSLKEGLDDLTRKIRDHKGAAEGLDSEAILLMPFMNWSIQHLFEELSHRRMIAPMLPNGSKTLNVAQSLRFKLDPFGAAVASGAILPGWWNGATHLKLIFDRPFLVVFKPRTQDRPICVLWIDNVELLQSWPPRKEGK